MVEDPHAQAATPAGTAAARATASAAPSARRRAGRSSRARADRRPWTCGTVVERVLQLGVLLDVRADLVERAARSASSACSNSSLGLDLGLAERHLHAAVGVDLALAGGLDRQEDHVLELVDHGRLHAVGLRGGHAAERLQRQHHVAQVLVRVVDVLGDFEVALAAAGARVVDTGGPMRCSSYWSASSCGDAAERLAQAVRTRGVKIGLGELDSAAIFLRHFRSAAMRLSMRQARGHRRRPRRGPARSRAWLLGLVDHVA